MEINLFEYDSEINVNTYVAGCSYADEEYIRKISLDTPISIVPEFENVYDSSAFAVYAELGGERIHIGYLPSNQCIPMSWNMKKHLEHGNEIKEVYVDKIYYDNSERRGRDGYYYPCIDISFKVKLNAKQIEKPLEQIAKGQKEDDLEIIEVNQETFLLYARPYLQEIVDIVDYNKKMYSIATFEHNTMFLDVEKLSESRLFQFEGTYKIRKGLLRLLFEHLELKLSKEEYGYEYAIDVELTGGFYISNLKRVLQELSELDEEQAEVVLALLSDDCELDYGYYNQIRGSEFASALDEEYTPFANKEEFERELEEYIQEYIEDIDDEDEKEIVEDNIRSEVRELTITLPSGKLAMIFYDDLSHIQL